MNYISTWTDLRTNRTINVDVFEGLDDALEDVEIFWRGAFPVQITVTRDGEVVAERQFSALL